MVYGQQEVVKDLIRARLDAGGQILFEAEALRRRRPRLRAADASASATAASQQTLECDFVAGCDGFWGVCRPAHPGRRAARLRTRVSVRLARHPGGDAAVQRGADLRLPRARLRAAQHALARDQPPLPAVSRRTSDLDDWPDERIWDELQLRFATDDGFDARRRARSSRRASPRCAASWWSRCSTGGCSWPATPRTSCRRPAPRA